MRWRILRSVLLQLLIAAAFTPFVPLANAQAPLKKVLVLYSTRRDAEFSRLGQSNLPRLLDTGLQGNLDYYSEFVDRARFPDVSYRTAFRDFLKVKYHDVRFDLVIAMQKVAVDFVTENHDGLFAKAPVLVLTNDPGWTRLANATGVINPRNFTGTLALIRRMQPDVENVFVITGSGPADYEFEEDLGKQLPKSRSRPNISYLAGLTSSELMQRLSHLPPRSAVYYVLMSRDRLGNNYHPLQIIDKISAAANAPVYSWAEWAMGHGILGGDLYVQSSVIERVSQLALRVLRGANPDDIAVSTIDASTMQLDWRPLRRWSIDETRRPAGTLIKFRNPNGWDEYGNYILAGLAILLMQTALIAGLLLQRRRRRQAEDRLRDSQGELQKSYERIRDLGSRLLQAQETERSLIAGELHDDICQRMLLLTIELESLKRANTSDATAAEAVSMAQDISKSLHELSHRLHPTRLRLLGLVPSLDQLCQDISRAGPRVKFTHQNVPPALAPEVMLCAFRIVQEALGNAIKYSGGSEVSVHLAAGAGTISLDIRDNGQGFDVEAAWGKGLGLMSMLERSEALDGTIEIFSRAGIGTRVTARIPASYCAETATGLVA
jgi:signal transduction histidine kinase